MFVIYLYNHEKWSPGDSVTKLRDNRIFKALLWKEIIQVHRFWSSKTRISL